MDLKRPHWVNMLPGGIFLNCLAHLTMYRLAQHVVGFKGSSANRYKDRHKVSAHSFCGLVLSYCCHIPLHADSHATRTPLIVFARSRLLVLAVLALTSRMFA